MPVAYTFEGKILWFIVGVSDSSVKRMKSLTYAFRDRRFMPGQTKMIWVASDLPEEDVPNEEEFTQIITLLVANKVPKIAIVIGRSDTHLNVAKMACDVLRSNNICCKVFLEEQNALNYILQPDDSGNGHSVFQQGAREDL